MNRLWIVGLTLLAFSCKKSNDGGNDPFNLPYNNLSVENNKALLEKEGRDFIKKIETLPDQKGIDVLEVLADLTAPEVNFEQRQIIRIGRKNGKAGAIMEAMNEFNRPSSRKKSLNELYGIFTYNSATKEWQESASSDKLSFIFPSTKNGTTNDANFTLTYTSSGIELESGDDDTVELPAEINGSLKVGAEEVVSIKSVHAYYNDGLPKTADSKIKLGDYEFSNIHKNENNTVNGVLSITKNGTTLLEWSINSSNKNFNIETLNDEDLQADDILKEANSTLTIGNVKLVTWANVTDFIGNRIQFEYPLYGDFYGNIDYNDEQAYLNATNAYYKAESEVSKKEAENLLELYQKYSKAVLISTTDNKILCSLDYEIIEDKECSYDGRPCNTYYNTEPVLVFGDKSKISFDVFGDTGFENLKTDYENFIDRF